MAFGYYRAITVDRTKCGTVDSANYPVLVKISGHFSMLLVASGGRINNSGPQVGGMGGTMPFDLVFSTDTAGTAKIPWEVDYYNSTVGDLYVWVKVPTLSVSVNTVFYMVYGDIAVNTQQNTGSFSPANVWDSNFLAVWHLGRPNTYTESTAAGLHLTNNLTTQVTAKIDTGINIGASGRSMTQPSTSALQFNYNSTLTVSMWVKLNSNIDECFVGNVEPANGYRGWEVGQSYQSSSHALQFYLVSSWPTQAIQSNSTINSPNLGISAFRFVTVTYSGNSAASGVRFYIDGVNSPTVSSNNALGTNATTGVRPTKFGSRFDGASQFLGNLDEVRISKVVRTQSWVTADWNNQNAPGNIEAPDFLIFGAEITVTPPVTGTATIDDRICAGTQTAITVREASIGGFN